MKPTALQSRKLAPTAGLCFAVLTSLIVIGCSAFKSGAPPTSFERNFFDVQTNQIPHVQAVTNLVPVTLYQTNVQPVTVYQTNVQGVTQTVTNYQITVIPQVVTNQVVTQQTNYTPAYTYSQNAGAEQAKEIGTAVGTPFGVGGLVGGGIGVLLGFWQWLRSSKLGATGATLAQEIQTIRSFITALPNGAVYDAALTQWMQQHQAETGTLQQVLAYLNNTVHDGNAQLAAQQIQAAITALNPSALPAGTKQATQA